MAGAGYKLFNTGDVLTAAQVNTYLMEQTVMVFADATARTTALSGVVAEGMLSYLKSTKQVEVYNGSAWVASDDPNAIQNTIVDAKGDLIAASAADTPARLAVGNNGETLVADSSTSTGLRWQPSQAAGKNVIINGGMDIWQRGTSSAISTTIGGSWGGDRFLAYRAVSGATVSQNSSTGLDGFRNAMRLQRNSGNTSTSGITAIQNVESSMAIPFAGKTVTLSFWARAGANYSATSSALAVYLWTGTGIDQPWFAYTGQATAINTTATLTTSWQRFSFTTTLASNVTEFATEFLFNPTGTAGANDWFEFTGVQLELGSVATSFTRAGGTLAGELAACQRYYYLHAEGSNVNIGAGAYFNANLFAASVSFPTQMRIAPSLVYTTGSGYYQIYANNGTDACDVLSIVRATKNSAGLDTGTGTAGTTGHGGLLATANAASSVAFNAEL